MRKPVLDSINVIDVEATCWEGNPPPGQRQEIIEIGVCPLEVSTGRRLEKRSILVRPERSRVSAFCTNLTTLTQQQVERGTSFREACAILRRDYPVIQGVILLFSFMYVLVNLLVDMLYTVFDPRIRY